MSRCTTISRSGRREHVPENASFVHARPRRRGRDEAALRGHDAVIHLAGSLEVAVSVEQPVAFTENNVVNTVRLLEAMRRADVGKIIFSSSATVYGVPERLPLREDDPLGMQANPYGATKVACETFLARVPPAPRLRLRRPALLQPVRPERAVRPGDARRAEHRPRDAGAPADPASTGRASRCATTSTSRTWRARTSRRSM